MTEMDRKEGRGENKGREEKGGEPLMGYARVASKS